MPYDKAVIITRPTDLEGLVKRYGTLSQAGFVLASRGQTIEEYKAADQVYKESVKKVVAAIPKELKKEIVQKDHLPSYHFANDDLVVAVGDDGMLVNVAKYLAKQPLISVNADPNRFDGVLASTDTRGMGKIIGGVIAGVAQFDLLTMAVAELEDGQTMYALNDLFIGKKTHVSARYTIEFRGKIEQQSSSGIIVSTGTGSTGWYTSVMGTAYALAQSAGNQYDFPEDADYLKFIVREAFPSKKTGTSLVKGDVNKNNPLKISSQMSEDGVIFSDGIESDNLTFNAGSTVTIKPAEKKVYIVKGE
ncbi:hypothetical protein COV16_03235 [Candidatus Woesearchaeota archaeon CG10_big_fil_rev_8_21_14_0_10_34_8]|nr:MAG: hypothetical protein COV16_03235 [Candidatus Woesearchaeota archaeon CG10_big_fil_rev_8_21_14_0_10_34_8]